MEPGAGEFGALIVRGARVDQVAGGARGGDVRQLAVVGEGLVCAGGARDGVSGGFVARQVVGPTGGGRAAGGAGQLAGLVEAVEPRRGTDACGVGLLGVGETFLRVVGVRGGPRGRLVGAGADLRTVRGAAGAVPVGVAEVDERGGAGGGLDGGGAAGVVECPALRGAAWVGGPGPLVVVVLLVAGGLVPRVLQLGEAPGVVPGVVGGAVGVGVVVDLTARVYASAVWAVRTLSRFARDSSACWSQRRLPSRTGCPFSCRRT